MSVCQGVFGFFSRRGRSGPLQAHGKTGIAESLAVVVHHGADHVLAAHQYHHALGAGDGSIEKVADEEQGRGVVHGDDDEGVLYR